MIWKTSEKRMKHKYKTQWKATLADYNKQKTESQNLKIKWKLKEKLKSYQSNNSSPAKGTCKNSMTALKTQT
jgi:hypothetical protein